MGSFDTLVSLCKQRGFIFQSSEIYGGIGGFWDYGPLGTELKNNIKQSWWRRVVQRRDDVVGLDAAIIMNAQTWVASGHVEEFTDPLIDCKQCKKRFRADAVTNNTCPECGAVGQLTDVRRFNLMFKTYVGPVEESAALTYLRPETAQGIFVNFQNVLVATRKKLPFGIAQIGKAFRNEITPGDFIFRDREFEQMEIEYFVKPGTDEEWHRHWVEERLKWYIEDLGLRSEKIRARALPKEDLAHYSKGTFEIEYDFPGKGWSEIEGIANRTDYDLKRHAQHSGKELTYFDEETKEHYIPYVIEPSCGVDRIFLATLLDAYHEEEVRGERRVVLRFKPQLAPIKVAVFPLLRNRPEIVQKAKALANALRKDFTVWYDDTAAIGRLYRRQDEIGTPFCITVDVQSLSDDAVTIRDRDSMLQERVPIERVASVIQTKLQC
ncbi:glycine--tRNA ligase [Candidatus Acetothermia bacterium]|jgi:glycyl-tRNA synthetase|nr:glycine--tRNA ligase [Candidatus Acetothermia bacterium]MCI2431773.1 glycine--tRNA ligase [Candidatus Acetothermia bacterium]MCI2436537.1 glycine--tRNA ligase [Candidatus Acetothermia bacterium]